MKFAHALHGIPVLSGTSERDLLYPTPDKNQRYQDETTGDTYRWNGSAWVLANTGAAGAVVLVDAFVLVGATDHLSGVNAALVAAPSGGTIQFSPGQTYNLSALPSITKPVTINLNGATVKATGTTRTDVLSTTDISNVVYQGPGTVDGNDVARSGLTSYANLVAPRGIRFRRVKVINLPQDDTLNHGAFRTASTSALRHADAKVEDCEIADVLTTGALLAYTDGAVIDGLTVDTLLNHSYEFVGCTNAQASRIRSKDVGGSGAGCGDHSYNVLMSDIVVDGANGDAGIVAENTSSDVKVDTYTVRNTWKSGVSANFGTAGTAPNELMRGVEFSNGILRASASKTITGATKANPCKLTVLSHGIKCISLSNTVQVSIASVAGMTQLNGTTPTVTTINPATGVYDANALWLVGVDSSAYGTYTSGGTVTAFAPAANLYGSSSPQAQGIIFRDQEVYGFNCGVAMLYVNGSECRNVRVNGLQGPTSAVGRFTYFTNGKVQGLRCYDASGQPSDPLGAVQFLNQPATANACNRVEIKDVFVLQCGASSDKPLLYLEGSGEFWIDGLRTGGASCFISVRAGDTPTIHLKNFSGSLSTVTPFILGALAVPVWDIQWEQRERSLTAAGTLSYLDGHVRCDATAGAFAVTLPAASTVPGKRYTITKTDAGANAVTITPAGADTIPTITTLASQDKSFVLIARSGGWDIEAAR